MPLGFVLQLPDQEREARKRMKNRSFTHMLQMLLMTTTFLQSRVLYLPPSLNVIPEGKSYSLFQSFSSREEKVAERGGQWQGLGLLHQHGLHPTQQLRHDLWTKGSCWVLAQEHSAHRSCWVHSGTKSTHGHQERKMQAQPTHSTPKLALNLIHQTLGSGSLGAGCQKRC